MHRCCSLPCPGGDEAYVGPRSANEGGPTKTVQFQGQASYVRPLRPMLADLLSRPQRRHTPCRGKEAHQPPPESECIPFAVAGKKVFRHTFSHRFLMRGIYFKQIALGYER